MFVLKIYNVCAVFTYTSFGMIFSLIGQKRSIFTKTLGGYFGHMKILNYFA